MKSAPFSPNVVLYSKGISNNAIVSMIGSLGSADQDMKERKD